MPGKPNRLADLENFTCMRKLTNLGALDGVWSAVEDQTIDEHEHPRCKFLPLSGTMITALAKKCV